MIRQSYLEGDFPFYKIKILLWTIKSRREIYGLIYAHLKFLLYSPFKQSYLEEEYELLLGHGARHLTHLKFSWDSPFK